MCVCHHHWFYIYVHMHELYTLCQINHHFVGTVIQSTDGNHGDSSGFGQNQPMSTPQNAWFNSKNDTNLVAGCALRSRTSHPNSTRKDASNMIQPVPGTFCSAERFLQRIYLYLASRSSFSSSEDGVWWKNPHFTRCSCWDSHQTSPLWLGFMIHCSG